MRRGFGPLLGGMLLGLTTALSCSATDVLDGVARVAVAVELKQPLDGVSGDALAKRIATLLAALEPPLPVDQGSTDRLRLTIAVRPFSSSDLRGFPLPFSGTYAVGSVRLSLHRAVEIAGSRPRIVSASVWERERQITTKGSAARSAVDRAVTQLLHEFGEVRRGAAK